MNGPREALMTDLGVTGGGNGRHMVYAAGRTDHTVEGASMIDHIVELVERRVEAIKAQPAEAVLEPV